METAQLPMKLELPDSLKEACPDAVKLPPGETVTDAEAGSALAAVIAIATIAFCEHSVHFHFLLGFQCERNVARTGPLGDPQQTRSRGRHLRILIILFVRSDTYVAVQR